MIDERVWLGQAPGMARHLRLQYPGAMDPLMSRGDHREPVFLEETDRPLFLSTLAEACAKTDWQVHAYWSWPWRGGCGGKRPCRSNGFATGCRWVPGNPSNGGFMNKNKQKVDMQGTPFMKRNHTEL
jgi:hypothetical protein